MKAGSRSKLAKAFVKLLDKYPRAQLVKALAAVVVEQKLNNQLDLLMRDINRELFRSRGHVEIDVQSARALSDEVLAQLQKFIKIQTGATSVSSQKSLNKQLLGGLIATTPSHELDLSIRSKLQRLEV